MTGSMTGSRPRAASSPKIDLLVIQPTPFCNLDCDYCYLPHRSDRRRIGLPTLKRVFEAVFESGYLSERLGVVWHAGEPMTMPIAFYRAAFRIAADLKPAGLALAHSFQTNGVLIDRRWCDFIGESGLQIGVSVDGPAFLHDRHRKTRSGRGTHDAAMRGIRLLQENGIAVHVICVLTRHSLEFPDEIFEFFVDNGIHEVGFNIEEIEGVNLTSTLAGDGIEARLRRFLRRFLGLLKENEGALAVREFDEALATLAAARDATTYNHQVAPFGIVSVDADGNIGTFSPELLGQRSAAYGNFTFGNVNDGGLRAVRDNPLFRKLRREIEAGVARCRASCGYFDVCGGGAPANKFYEHGRFDGTETMFCRFTKQAVFDVVLSDIEAGLARRSPGPRAGEPVAGESLAGSVG